MAVNSPRPAFTSPSRPPGSAPATWSSCRLTFTASAEVVRYLGADPVLVDVDPDTLNLDPAAVEAA